MRVEVRLPVHRADEFGDAGGAERVVEQRRARAHRHGEGHVEVEADRPYHDRPHETGRYERSDRTVFAAAAPAFGRDAGPRTRRHHRVPRLGHRRRGRRRRPRRPRGDGLARVARPAPRRGPGGAGGARRPRTPRDAGRRRRARRPPVRDEPRRRLGHAQPGVVQERPRARRGAGGDGRRADGPGPPPRPLHRGHGPRQRRDRVLPRRARRLDAVRRRQLRAARAEGAPLPAVRRRDGPRVGPVAGGVPPRAQAPRTGEVGDLLVLDGPLYPKRLLNWATRDRELREVAHGDTVQEAVATYVRLVESCIERDVPVLGFVKNPTSGYITRTLDRKGIEAPWPDDAALFTRLLERREDGERDDDAITFTSWLRSRGGSDRPLASDGDALGVDRSRDPTDYEVTYMHVYEPREDVLFKVEAPAAFTADADTRARLTRQVISEVAAEAGPPTPVAKADELARIGVGEKQALRRKFEERFGAEFLRTYDDVRWAEE
ncbi:DNA double-strand break repair nuclease NurA [Halobaculum litoreum]|uniref:DNA double-strand break repair nuclease NurA n=1 Tax=Halobaculum litoreum TaxID=3031998 RepID=A0ABD5XTZ0_9EURY